MFKQIKSTVGGQRNGVRFGSFINPDNQIRVTIPRLDLMQIACQNRSPMMQQNQIVTVFLNRRHLVGGHHNILARLDQFADQVTQQLGIDRVKPRERVVEKNEQRVVDEGGDQLYLLLISL